MAGISKRAIAENKYFSPLYFPATYVVAARRKMTSNPMPSEARLHSSGIDGINLIFHTEARRIASQPRL
jgi:hypothetical protein